MDLKKLFVYVSSTDEPAFLTGVVGGSGTSDYANKIVFLEKSGRIWARGKFYGLDNEELKNELKSLWLTLGLTETKTGATAFSESYAEQAYTDLLSWIKAVKAGIEKSVDDLEKKLPKVAVKGSGLKLETSTDETTKSVTYTVVADESIWEFMGTATSATVEGVSAAINAKYGQDGVRGTKEKGDVWAVTVNGNTLLYAWDGNAWVQIGSATGISGVDTTASHGVALKDTSSLVSVVVTPGEVVEDNTSVITGGAAYTAIQTAYNDACAYAYLVATNAYNLAYNDCTAYTAAVVDDLKSKTVYSFGIAEGSDSYLGIAYGGGANGTSYTLSVDMTYIYNYVMDNLWEVYSQA